MESQINSLETRIEKMQERFNKDLEEKKKRENWRRRDCTGREEGGGFSMGNTCIPVADSC